MRIISGKYKGKRITAPKKLPVRPTTDMAKEGLFNILNHRFSFSNISVLDLFSGTGNISFEFASRGTQNITAVDQSAHCVGFISQTAKELDFSITTHKSNVFPYVSRAKESYDLIFADPPYKFDVNQFQRIVETIFSNHVLKEEGTLVIEHASLTDLSGINGFVESRKYSNSTFSFFENSTSAED